MLLSFNFVKCLIVGVILFSESLLPFSAFSLMLFSFTFTTAMMLLFDTCTVIP